MAQIMELPEAATPWATPWATRRLQRTAAHLAAGGGEPFFDPGQSVHRQVPLLAEESAMLIIDMQVRPGRAERPRPVPCM